MGDKQSMVIRLGRVLRYNRNRIERALSLFDNKTRPIFQCIPFLLQVNHPEFPGYVDDPELPYGLFLYSFSRDIQVSLIKTFPEQASIIGDPKPIWPKEHAIESLSVMGSTGTMAQSAKSDLDYWVCVDGKKVSGKKWDLLQQKLELIEQWAWDNHHLEVHFFLSDIEKVRKNDFGAADGESAGSAQPLFLKNEYYTTHIVLAGKMPFWWLVPADCSDETYKANYMVFKQMKDPDPSYFMDLGNVQRLNVNEMFGASLWQLTKAMDSPFKSVLKMAKLEVFMDSTDKRMPVCNVLKHRVHTTTELDRKVRNTDPYAVMFDTILKFYQLKQPKFIDLFKTCLYIKSACPLSRPESNKDKTFKFELVRNYVMQWKWKQDKISHYDSVDKWHYARVERLGKVIHGFLIGCYRRLSAKLKGAEQSVSDEDMTVIGRKIESFYTAKPGKIQYLKRAFESGLMQKQITVTMDLDLSFDTKQRWTAFRGKQHLKSMNAVNPSLLKESSDPVDLSVWCLFNRIADLNTEFYLPQSQLTITERDIKELLDGALKDFEPVRISDLPRDKLLQQCEIVYCLVVINFASHPSVSEVETVRVMYLTSWGEVFSFEEIESFKNLEQRFDEQKHTPVCKLFTPERNDRDVLYPLIEEMTGFVFDKVGYNPAVVVKTNVEEKKPSCPWTNNTQLIPPNPVITGKQK